jgi:general secretion pathway protein I
MRLSKRRNVELRVQEKGKEERRKAGFTLLEILISLAVIGGLLVTLLYTLNYHLGIAERHKLITVATILAKEKISEIEQKRSADSGFFGEPHKDVAFEAKIVDSLFPGMQEIEVMVTNGQEVIRLSKLVEKNYE